MRPEDVLLMEPEAARARLAGEGFRVTLVRLEEPVGGAGPTGGILRVVRARARGGEVEIAVAGFPPPKVAVER